MSERQVLDKCQEAGVAVSASEPLPKGGTHLVCMTSDGADEMRLRFRDHIITEVILRFPFYNNRGP